MFTMYRLFNYSISFKYFCVAKAKTANKKEKQRKETPPVFQMKCSVKTLQTQFTYHDNEALIV